jgi:hypothetical protein
MTLQIDFDFHMYYCPDIGTNVTDHGQKRLRYL